jgi:hypothetical protein
MIALLHIRAALGLTLLIIASCTGQAQQLPSPPPAPNIQESVIHYCFFNSQIYSVGSILCVPQAKAALVCQSTAEDQNKSATGRAAWRTAQHEIQCK